MPPTFRLSPSILALLLFLQLPLTVLGQHSDYIPWTWRLRPDSESGDKCPSTVSILLTFAAVNILVSIITLITGHRAFVKWMSCGLFDGGDNKATWFYMFIFPLGLNLGPNALIAYIYQTTSGFGQDFSIWDLTLFYTTRPRLSWIVLVLCMNIDAIRDKKTNYIRSAKAAVAAEVCLQILSSFYMGKTANFAAEHKYYNLHSGAPHNAEVMYAGALLSLVSLFFTLICLIYILFSDAEFDTQFLAVIVIGCTSWLASWVFWGGFVSLAGDDYCPPKLWQSGVIWTAFSILGTFLGGAG